MNRVILHFTPTPNDYFQAIRRFMGLGRKNYSVMQGIFAPLLLILFITLIVRVLNAETQSLVYFLPATVFLLLIIFLPDISGLLIARKASKNSQFLAPITYEFDEEKININSKVVESKIDWSAYNKVLETNDYYLLVYAANKNMIQFLPKRAIESQVQEDDMRLLMEQKLGKIVHVQKGISGWKLSLITSVIFIAVIMCTIMLVVLYSMFSDGTL